MANKAKLIAVREFKIQIKRWSFWLVTLGLPVFMFLIFAFSLMVGILVGSSKGKKETALPPIMAVVDEGNLLPWESFNEGEETQLDPFLETMLKELQLKENQKQRLERLLSSQTTKSSYKTFDSLEMAQEALEAKEVRGILHLKPGYLQNQDLDLQLYDERRSTRSQISDIQERLRNRLLIEYYQEEEVAQIINPLEGKVRYLIEKKEKEPVNKKLEELTKMGMPMMFCMALMLVMLTSTDRLLRGMVEEKSNRVIELLLSSVTAEDLMAGKVIGLGVLGLVQLCIWLTFVFLPLSFLLAFFNFGMFHLMVFFLFFVFGYFLLATPILGFGSLGSNLQEANQWAMIFILGSLLPMIFLPHIVSAPDTLLVKVFTYLPLTSPLTVVTRLGLGDITVLEISISLALLILANILAVKVSAKVFRIGILMSGKSPTPAALWKALKNA